RRELGSPERRPERQDATAMHPLSETLRLGLIERQGFGDRDGLAGEALGACGRMLGEPAETEAHRFGDVGCPRGLAHRLGAAAHIVPAPDDGGMLAIEETLRELRPHRAPLLGGRAVVSQATGPAVWFRYAFRSDRG